MDEVDDYRQADLDKVLNSELYNPSVTLKKLMHVHNINAYTLETLTGIHHNTIYNWTTKNAQPSYANFLACVNAMGYKLQLKRRGPEDE